MNEQSVDMAIKYLEEKSKVLGKLGGKVRYRLKELEQRVIDAHPSVDAVITIALPEPANSARFGYNRAAKFWIQVTGDTYVYNFDDIPLFLAAACYRNMDALLAALVDNTQLLQKSLEVI